MASVKQESKIIGVIQIAKLKKSPQKDDLEFGKAKNNFIKEQSSV